MNQLVQSVETSQHSLREIQIDLTRCEGLKSLEELSSSIPLHIRMQLAVESDDLAIFLHSNCTFDLFWKDSDIDALMPYMQLLRYLHVSLHALSNSTTLNLSGCHQLQKLSLGSGHQQRAEPHTVLVVISHHLQQLTLRDAVTPATPISASICRISEVPLALAVASIKAAAVRELRLEHVTDSNEGLDLTAFKSIRDVDVDSSIALIKCAFWKRRSFKINRITARRSLNNALGRVPADNILLKIADSICCSQLVVHRRQISDTWLGWPLVRRLVIAGDSPTNLRVLRTCSELKELGITTSLAWLVGYANPVNLPLSVTHLELREIDLPSIRDLQDWVSRGNSQLDISASFIGVTRVIATTLNLPWFQGLHDNNDVIRLDRSDFLALLTTISSEDPSAWIP